MSNELYQIAQAKVSGGSGLGNSFWSVAANCGHQRNLKTATPRDPNEPQPDWAVRGTYYHLLHEWHQAGRIPAGQALLVDSDLWWNEAVTLFNWHVETYPKDAFGTVVGTEVQIPGTPEAQEKIAKAFGVPYEWCPTGRYDALSVVDDAQVERAANLWGLLLPGPGRYAIDHKHGKQHSMDDEAKYTAGEQPVMYMTLDRILNPENPIRGMIFAKTSMTREKGVLKKKDTSFRTYVATWQPSFYHRCTQMVQSAYRSMVDDTYNGYMCGECPFYQKVCEGYKP